MRTIVLDDHGRAWDGQSLTLRCSLGCATPDFDLLNYLVDNLGFVTVSSVRPGATRMRLRFATAAPASVAAALYLLADMSCERIVVSQSDADGVDRLFSRVADAASFIDQRVARTALPGATHIESRQLPIETLAGGTGPLSIMLSLWSGSDRSLDLGFLKLTMCRSESARFMALKAVDHRLTIVDLGSGFDSFSKNWQSNAVGMPVEEQPDYEYGRWVHRMYEAVLDTGEPRLDDIDATIRRPHLNDKVRLLYQRLILPFKGGPHGSTRLVGASVVRQSIRL